MTAAYTLEHGQVAVFVAVDHASAECVGVHAALHGTRHEALEPVRQGVAERFGSVEKNAAEGLAIRHNHGFQYMSRDFQREIAWLGATDHDRTLSFDGTDFEPESGLTASEVRSGSDLSVDAQDAEGC